MRRACYRLADLKAVVGVKPDGRVVARLHIVGGCSGGELCEAQSSSGGRQLLASAALLPLLAHAQATRPHLHVQHRLGHLWKVFRHARQAALEQGGAGAQASVRGQHS